MPLDGTDEHHRIHCNDLQGVTPCPRLKRGGVRWIAASQRARYRYVKVGGQRCG